MTVAAPATRLLVLHDAGDAAAGGHWRAAAVEAGWPGAVDAPDLPGHGSEPAPAGGCYDPGDATLFVVRRGLAPPDGDPALVAGVGSSAWPAWVLALGGRAAGLVLVDGLGGPWRDATGRIAAVRGWLRAIADDPDALAAPPPSGLDPRLHHGLPAHGSRALVTRAAAATRVPVLLVETPASPLTAAEVDGVLPAFAAPVEVARLADGSPTTVLAAVTTWWSSRSGG